MPAAIPGPNWRYKVGDEISGRKILSQEKAGNIADRNLYRIQYACCGSIGTMTQQSLRRIDRLVEKTPDLDSKPCNKCCALKASKAAKPDQTGVKEKPPSDLSLRYPGERVLMTAWTSWAPPKEEEKGKHFICR